MRQYEHASEILQQWMKQKGVSAAEMAEKLQIDAGILRAILSGRQKNISTRNMILLARYFDISLQNLIDALA